MRKLLASFIVLLLFGAKLSAQTTVEITGKVRDSAGVAIPAATINEKGTKNSVGASNDGTFNIKVKSGAQLVITAIGFLSREVAATNNVSVSLYTDARATNLQEVVVTSAFGIKRRPKEVGYSNTLVTADKITAGNSPTLGQALSGKVAGLNIQNITSGVTQDVRITLRGNRSITGNNQALIVLDGVPVPSNTVNYINPNDIESVTVLKGGQAATLYGTDGVNGVLMISTKKGTGRPVVNFQHSSTWDRISFMPEFQTSFGSGSDYGGNPNSIDNFRPFENQQYGDRLNGQIREQGRVLADGSYLQVPYANVPNNRKDAFNTGYVEQNDVSLSGGDERSRFFMSAQDYARTGVVPGDKYRRDNVRFNASRTFGKFKATFDGTYAQDRQQTTTSTFYFNVLNTAPEIQLTDFRDWRNNKFAGEAYYNDYYPNPYFAADNNRADIKNNYLNGNLQLEFKPVEWFAASYRAAAANTTTFEKDYTGQFLYSAYIKTAQTHSPQYNDYNGRYYANTNILGSVSDISTAAQRLNSDLLLNFSKNFRDFSTKLILGNAIQRRYSQSTTVASSSIVVPGIYNIGNRSGDLTGSGTISDYRKYGNFADLTVGYADYIFVHGSVRNDRTSLFYTDTAAKGRYSYWLYGGDVSFVLTDAFKSLHSNVLSFAKLRAGYNVNYNDNLNPYDLTNTYSNATGSPFGTVVGLTTGNTFPDPGLKPERVQSFEVGLEVNLLNRINVDVSAYTQRADRQIITAGVSSATGYTNYRVNAADLKNKGLEVEARATIIRGRNFSWDVNANYTYNTNKVVSIFQNLPRFQSAAYSTYGYLFAELNQPFPLLKTTGFQKDSLGRTIISATDGWPVRDAALHAHGNTLPMHTIGFGTKFTYKSFTFSTNIEVRTGYSIYNAIGHDLSFTGSGALTAKYDRKPFLWPNSSYADGTGKYVANTGILVDSFWAWYDGWGNVGQPRAATQIGDFFVTSGRFLKVRDASLSYALPGSLLRKTNFVKGVTITVVGRNLITLLPKDNIYTDPEFSATATTSNAQGINTTGAALNAPPTRSYGFTVNVNF